MTDDYEAARLRALIADMLPYLEPARLREEAAAIEGTAARMPVRSIVRRAQAVASTPAS